METSNVGRSNKEENGYAMGDHTIIMLNKTRKYIIVDFLAL